MASNLEISAVEDTVSSVLSRDKVRFRVPEYQRSYAWQEKQLEEFWNDLLEVTEEGGTHFLGSIVVVKKDQGLDKMAILEIVDGQQRLATVSVLLCILRQKFSREASTDGGSNPADQINRKYLWKEDEDLNKKPNLTLSTFDNDEYKQLLNGRFPDNEESQLVEAAEFFSEKINRMSLDEINEVRKRLVNSMTLVTINCDSEGSAFKLFETLNNRGLELSAVDLMKNHLFSIASEDVSINENLVREDWESIIKTIKPELSKPGRFFRHYIMAAKEPEISEAISNYKLYERFCELVDEDIPESNVDLEEYVSDMRNKAHLYVDIVNADVTIFNQRADNKINDKIEKLNSMGITQERTLLLRLFTELDNPNELIRSLKLIESFVFRWRITGQPTGTDVDEIHANLCSSIFKDRDPVERLKERLQSLAPEDPEIRLGVRTQNFPRNDRTRYILTKIEDEYYSNGKKTVDPDTIEIEHIAPRKAYTAKKYSTWPTYLGVSKEEFEEHVNLIGNLTILDERVNARAQNNPFRQKKKEYEASDYEITKELCNKDEWSVEEIEKRTEMIAEVCPKLWDFNL